MLLSPIQTVWSNYQVWGAERLLQVFLQRGLVQLCARCGPDQGRRKTFPSEAVPCCQLAQPQPAGRAHTRAV